LLGRHGDVLRFVQVLVKFRERRDVVAEEGTLTLNQLLQWVQIDWHGTGLHRPDWSEHSHALAFTLKSLSGRFLLHGIFNAYWEPLTFELPPVPEGGRERWRRCIDTALASPDDINPWDQALSVAEARYVAQPRSVVLLALALQGDGGGSRPR
jgi:glycogen operon protein